MVVVDRCATKGIVMLQNKNADNCQAFLKLSPEGMLLWSEDKEDSVFFRSVLAYIILI